MLRQQRLVRCDHMLAVFDRPHDEVFGDVGASDQLDDDVDLGIADYGERIGSHLGGIANYAPGAVQILVGDDFESDSTSGTTRDLFLVPTQHRKGTSTYDPDAEQADVDGSHAKSLRKEKDGMTNPSRK